MNRGAILKRFEDNLTAKLTEAEKPAVEVYTNLLKGALKLFGTTEAMDEEMLASSKEDIIETFDSMLNAALSRQIALVKEAAAKQEEGLVPPKTNPFITKNIVQKALVAFNEIDLAVDVKHAGDKVKKPFK